MSAYLVGHNKNSQAKGLTILIGGPSQAILKQAPGAEIVDFLCAQGFRAARTEGAKS